MRFTTATTTAPFHGVTTLQAWRAAARARCRTPNLAYMQGRFRSAYVDPHRVSSVSDLLSADPRKMSVRIVRVLTMGSSMTTSWHGGRLTEVSWGGGA